MNDLDLEHLQTWVGRTETVSDLITESLIDRFRATFFDKLWPMEGIAPLGLHWCLAPPAAPGNALGPDGHPKRGGFLPPVPLPSRMWAGGELEFHAPLRAGDQVTRQSRIESVQLKQGRSGPLVFVSVDHQCMVGNKLAVSERQNLVYKQANRGESSAALKHAEADAEEEIESPDTTDTLSVGRVELFRYSALTFNGHRIHYDRDYARAEEGYPGLVVHGPFQTTLLINRAAQLCDGVPARFSFRGVAPLIEQTPFRIRQLESADQPDSGKVWCETLSGETTMQADYSKT